MRAASLGESGGMYIEFAVCMTVLFSVFAMLLTVPPIFIYKQNMDSVCRQVATAAAEAGSVGEDISEFAQELMESYGIDGTVEFSGDISDKKVQLRSRFTTTLHATYSISLGREWSVDIDLFSTTQSMGRRYLK